VNREAAQALSLEALAFLAADENRLGALLAQCGWSLPELRAGAADPLVLAGVMDFLLGNETWLLEFCAETGCKPEMPMRARRLLPGAEDE
jgi:hypothetical protein